jgi:hypothetical protein
MSFLSAPPMKIVGFEEMQNAIQHKTKGVIIINVLPPEQQECLITNTLPIALEEKTINDWMLENNARTQPVIVLYGKNCGDYATLEKKCKQLSALGFFEVQVYLGGLFEWVLLQDIYGAENFPTSKRVLDILQFRS